MKRILLYVLLFMFALSFAQTIESDNLPGRVFKFEPSVISKSVNAKLNQSGKIKNQTISLPLINGKVEKFNLTENSLTENRVNNVTTFDGVNTDKSVSLKLSVFDDKINAIIKTQEGYFMVEPYKTKQGEYRIYNVFENLGENFHCGTTDKSNLIENLNDIKNGLTLKSAANFPYGSQIRKFRMAIATTGEFTQAFGGDQDKALAEAVSMLNLINKIYESEVSITFSLISETTDKTLIFTDPTTDPFTVDPSFASANNSQSGFNTLNNNKTLLYDKYDIGHTFNILSNGGAQGQAGPQPCTSNQKARAWSQWDLAMPKAITANLIVHEMGHQFGAGHTYNAIGGTSSNPSFCTVGWNASAAVEPGGGTTIMGYNSNCSLPTNQTNNGNYNLNYFNAKSLDQITSNLVNSATCYNSIASSNLAPSSNAGIDITIPKNTPFKLKGIGIDPDNTKLSYTWEQIDVASANDKGAFGNSVNGSGGYTAVNSTESAPLFRSEQSYETTERYFPKMRFILNNQNNPPVNEAEALPAVARTMKFRFTVRDNNVLNGGVDSDEILVIVSNNGPLSVTYPNTTGISIAAGETTTITWNVNGTNAEKPTVNVLLSTDGGLTFPYTLGNNVANNGTLSTKIPYIPATAKARIKVVGAINDYAEFFDVSDNDFSITSNCVAYPTYISPSTSVSTTAGASAANLNMTTPLAIDNEYISKTFNYNTLATNNNLIAYSDNTKTTPKLIINNYPSYSQKFRVTKTGVYSLSNSTGGFLIISIHTGISFSTSNFLVSNAYNTTGGSYISDPTTESVNLTEGTDYYLMATNFTNPANSNTYTVTINGPGNLYEVTTTPAGYSYTYAAIDDSTSKISAVNNTADFTTLAAGNYTVKGISYNSTVNATTFVGKTINDLVTASTCLYESKNSRSLIISKVLSTTDVKDSEFVLAPNPVDDILYIKSKKTATDYEIIDISGRIVSKKANSDNTISFRGLIKGTYIVKLYDNNTVIYQTKIIKK